MLPVDAKFEFYKELIHQLDFVIYGPALFEKNKTFCKLDDRHRILQFVKRSLREIRSEIVF